MVDVDRGSQNPRLQCGECGRWMRLHGKRIEAVNGNLKEVSFQRFHGACEDGNDHPCGKDVCAVCCPAKCRARRGCDCQHPDTTISGFAAVSVACPVHGDLGPTLATTHSFVKGQSEGAT